MTTTLEIAHDDTAFMNLPYVGTGYWITALSDGRFAFIWGGRQVVEAGEPLDADLIGSPTDAAGIEIHAGFADALESLRETAEALRQHENGNDAATAAALLAVYEQEAEA